MSDNTKNQVLDLLTNYKSDCERITLLRYELQHAARISQDEMIEAMNFSHGDGTADRSGHVSDKTFYIANQFRAEAAERNNEVIHEIADRLVELEEKINRLEYYMTLLKDQERQALRAIYYENCTLQETSEALGVSKWTVRKLRDAAVDRLVSMYSFVQRTE